MNLNYIKINKTETSILDKEHLEISYQVFGKPIGEAAIILVNHALTGNSLITGKEGWWQSLIGKNQTIDPKFYTILAFDIPGNGFDGKTENLITDYKNFNTKEIAKLFWLALNKLNIEKLHCVIGGSLGGAIAWEMVLLKPKNIEILIPIACTNKASDWLIGNVFVQDAILNHSKNPIEDARMHAMLLYRTPDAIQEKFQNEYNQDKNVFDVECWLLHHGNKLKNRFALKSYKLMNHLLKTIGADLTENKMVDFLKETTTKIHMISVDTDYMFTEKEQYNTYTFIKKRYKNIQYNKIQSIHGHDAFLIEYQQLHHLLNQHFKN